VRTLQNCPLAEAAAENMSFGRNFRMGKEGNTTCKWVEFQNISLHWLKRGCEAPKAVERHAGGPRPGQAVARFAL
jgi:hypothetical protein